MKFTPCFVLTVLCSCVSLVSCQSHYVRMLTGGLRPPEIPEEFQDVVRQLVKLNMDDVTRMIQASDILPSLYVEEKILATDTTSSVAPNITTTAPNTTTTAPNTTSTSPKSTTPRSTTTAIPSASLSPSIALTPSPKCLNQTGEVLMGLLAGQQWALQMLDAAGKPGSALLQFQIVFLGSYKECIAVRSVPSAEGVESFRGKYCKANLPLTPSSPTPGNAQAPAAGVAIGLCFPDSCQDEDVTLILNSLFQLVLKQLNVSLPLEFKDTMCQEEDREWDTKAVAVFVVAMVFVFLILLGTIYDIIFIQMPSWYMLSAKSESLMNGAGGVEANTSLNIKRHQDETSPLLGEEKKPYFQQPEPNLCGKVLASFSVYTNAGKLLSTKQPPGSLSAVHGIRFLSMTWVLLGHTYVFGIASIGNLLTFFPEVLKRFTFQAILNATVSVDSFFVLSGLLVSYLVLKEMRRSGGKINWFMFYFHRYWRLTPPYMLLLMVYVPLFPYLTTGPLWPKNGVELNQCRDSWWTNLLYVNNLVKTKEICMGWTWYLANDMQFYILSPLLFVPLFFSSVLGLISVMVFLLATLITAGAISRVENLPPSLAGNMNNLTAGGSTQMDYFFDYYIVPYCRMGPYIVGVVTGYLLYKTDCKIRMNKSLVVAGWCIATASALAVLYGLYDLAQGNPVTVDVAAFYNSVHRTVWGSCLCWVIFACATGYGGFVNTILSWKGFIPLSRLTYCVYLVHPIVMYTFFSSQEALLFISDINVVYWFFGNLFASYIVAFVVSMAFEAPMMGLEKAFLRKEKSS